MNEKKQDKKDQDRQAGTLGVDVAYYQKFLDGTDIPEDKRQELIETLWNIMVTFVDLGFGIEPTQQALKEAPGRRAKRKRRKPEPVKKENNQKGDMLCNMEPGKQPRT